MPTLKEKKRYLAFDVISEREQSFPDVSKAIWSAVCSFVGMRGAAAMGLHLFAEKYNNQQGILKVAHTHVDAINASLALVTTIHNEPVIIRSLGASGVLRKTEQYVGGK